MDEDALERERLQYQWYTAYEKTGEPCDCRRGSSASARETDEYPKNPEWTSSILSETISVEGEDGDYTRDQVKFFDRFDPQHIYIKSDTVYNLFRMC